MRTVKVERLTTDGFLAFGFYADILNAKSEKLGTPPIEFYRDQVQQDLGGATRVSFSNCRVEKRPLVIDVTEAHSVCGEGALPLDNDMLLHVAPASPPAAGPDLDKVRVFRVPAGTMVVLRPGVWHHAPFTPNQRPVNVLIALPERTYANDCHVVKLPKAQRIAIQL
jgi:ureidoglycolate lyase